jgi:hypothetical protein
MRSTTALAAIAGLAAAGSIASGVVTLEKVIQNSDAVPGIPGASFFVGSNGLTTAASGAAIDSQGNVFFRAKFAAGASVITGNGTQVVCPSTVPGDITLNSEFALYYGGPGSLQLLARNGSPVFDNNPLGATFNRNTGSGMTGISNYRMAPNGTMAFSAFVRGECNATYPDNNNNSLSWSGTPGNWTALARRGDQAPTLPAGVIFSTNLTDSGASQFPTNNQGQSFYAGSVTGTGVTALTNGGAMFFFTPSQPAVKLFQLNDPVDGTSFGGLYAGTTSQVALNGKGQYAFLTYQKGGTIAANGSNDGALVSNIDGSLVVLTEETALVPVPSLAPATWAPINTAVGLRNSSVSTYNQALNNRGRLVYFGLLSGSVGATPVTTNDDTGLFTYSGGTHSLIVRENDPSPVGDALFAQVPSNSSNVRLNNNNLIAFVGTLRSGATTIITTANDEGIYLHQIGGGTSVIVREGDDVGTAVAGVPSGVLFGTLFNVILNNSGQIVFGSTVTGTGITTANDRRMYSWSQKTGQFEEIIVENQTYFGVAAVNASYSNAANGEGGCEGLSDTGWLAIGAWEAAAPGNSVLMRVQLPGVGCDTIDFNGDGIFPDNQDIVDFLEAFAGNACATCGDLDINNDAIFPDNGDIVKFVELFAGAPC